MNNIWKHTQSIFRKPGMQKGFTLLLAALVASIVLSIGAAIFSVASKEVTLSSAGRESQFAFYAADSAAECALYWDVRYAYFATSSPSGVTPYCDGQVLSPIVTSGTRSSGTYTMGFTYAPNGYCTSVSISKTLNVSSGAIQSVIHANGFSTQVATPSSCASAVAIDANVLQRSVELNY